MHFLPMYGKFSIIQETDGMVFGGLDMEELLIHSIKEGKAEKYECV